MVAVAHGARTQRGDIAATARLGDAERADLAVAQARRDKARVLLGRAEADDRRQRDAVRAEPDDRADRAAREDQLRDQGRNTVGVWGIRPEAKDYVIGSALVRNDATLLVAGENGIGKRTPFDDYRKQSRGGKGIITMKTADKTGKVIGALTVTDNDEIMLITSGGQMVRTRVAEIRETGRNTMGVKLMGLASGEKLQAIAPVVAQEAEDEIES